MHGGLADGIGMALMEVIAFDEERQLPRRLVHGLPAADLDGVPELGAGRDGHAVAAPPARRARAWASRPRWARRRRSSTPCSTRWPSGCATPTCRSRPPQVWRAMQGNVRSAPTWRSSEPCSIDRAGAAHGRSCELHRGARSCCARRGAGRAADLGQARRRGDRAGRRHDRGLRRRRVRRVDGAGAGAGAARLGRVAAAADHAHAEEHRRPGKLTVHNPCLSGGTLEIFLEPVVPAPLVLVRGDAPIARALRRARRAPRLRRAPTRRRDPDRRRRRRGRVARARRGGGARPPRCGPACPTSASSPAASGARRWSPRSTCARRDSVPGAHARRPRPRRAHARGGGAVDPGRDRRARPRPIADVRSPTADGHVRRRAGGAVTAIDPVCGMTVAMVESSLHLDHDGERHLVLRHRVPARLRRRPERVRRTVTRASPSSSPTSTTLRARLDAVDYLADQGWRRRCSAPCGCRSRCCSKARPASARPRRPRRWPPCSTRR